VGDEVVVAAVAGDPEHLVVLGGLWNGVDAAGHAPGRQHWVTPAGNTLSFVEGAPGEDAEAVELHTKAGKAWVQLAQRGPTGVPTVTVHSEGDLALEAPNGQLRVTAKSYVAHVAGEHATRAGAHTTESGGAVTVESGGRVAVKAGGELALRAGGQLRAHGAAGQTLTGATLALNPPGATAPAVAARVPGLPASAWAPRAVPGPGPGRSTEDPKTPTKRDLARRETERAPAWVELEYRHPDHDTPMAGAPYRVRFADGSVREGRLGADGTARIDGLPPALAGTAVAVTFGEVPDDYRPAAAPDAGGPNPHFRGAQADVAVFDGRPLLLASAAPGAGLAAAAAWAGHFRGAAADALEWLWGVLLGDFAENPSTGQIITGAVVTMIPVVDQIADVRDVFANVRHLFDDRRRADPWTWVALAITLVGIVPVFGSAAKGALRLVVKALREGGSTTRRAVFAVIRKLGHGDPERFVARHLNAAAMRGAARAQLARVLGMLRGFFGAAARSRWAPESVRAAAGRALGRLGVVEREAPARLDEAVAVLDRGVQRALREGDSDAVARGTTNGRVRAEAETADPPGGGGSEPPGQPADPAPGAGAVARSGASPVALETGKQGKHIPGHNNYQPGKSILTHPNPQGLLDRYAGTGQRIVGAAGGPGKERVDFGQVIGQVNVNGVMTNTTRGIIHYSNKGAHIVPANP
jgi:hypothetical protein